MNGSGHNGRELCSLSEWKSHRTVSFACIESKQPFFTVRDQEKKKHKQNHEKVNPSAQVHSVKLCLERMPDSASKASSCRAYFTLSPIFSDLPLLEGEQQAKDSKDASVGGDVRPYCYSVA